MKLNEDLFTEANPNQLGTKRGPYTIEKSDAEIFDDFIKDLEYEYYFPSSDKEGNIKVDLIMKEQQKEKLGNKRPKNIIPAILKRYRNINNEAELEAAKKIAAEYGYSPEVIEGNFGPSLVIKAKEITKEELTEDIEPATEVTEELNEAKSASKKEILNYIKEVINSTATDADKLIYISGYVDKQLSLNESIEEIKIDDEIVTEEPKVENEEIPSTPITETDNGMTLVLNDLLKSEIDAIDLYNSAVLTAKEHAFDDIAAVLTEIANDENKHMGSLSTLLGKVNPQTESVPEGMEEAEDILNNVEAESTSETEETFHDKEYDEASIVG